MYYKPERLIHILYAVYQKGKWCLQSTRHGSCNYALAGLVYKSGV